MSDQKQWAQALKPGDEIAVRRGYGYATYSILTVDRVTASQIVVGGMRFRKDTLRRLGNGTGIESVTMLAVTQEIRDAVETTELQHWLHNLTRTKQPLSALRAMKAAFDAHGVPEVGRG